MPEALVSLLDLAAPAAEAGLALAQGHARSAAATVVALINLLCLAAMAADKAAAVLRLPRIPESLLLAAALAGGGPALLLARALLRHKTRRWAFAIAGWAGCASALVWACA